MDRPLLAAAAQFLSERRAYALATVVRRQRPSSAIPGNTAVIAADGETHGWIGGRCTQPEVVRHAQSAIRAGRPRLLGFGAKPGERDGVVPVPMSCGSEGKVDVHINPVLPAPRLVIAGDSPIAEALARVGDAVGWEVVRHAEGGADLAEKPVFQDVANREALTWGGTLGPGRAPGDRLYAVVATMGQGDARALEELAAIQPDYLGVVASPKRMRELRRGLVEAGVAEGVAGRVRGPAGLDIGAVKPAEVAVSIVAEIVSVAEGAEFRAQPAGPSQEDAEAEEGSDAGSAGSCCAGGGEKTE